MFDCRYHNLYLLPVLIFHGVLGYICLYNVTKMLFYLAESSSIECFFDYFPLQNCYFVCVLFYLKHASWSHLCKRES